MNGNKVWICFYTCCAIRAVHLEMTTEAFIRSFKRFTARRGFLCRMISNNEKTFKSAAKSLGGNPKLPRGAMIPLQE